MAASKRSKVPTSAPAAITKSTVKKEATQPTVSAIPATPRPSTALMVTTAIRELKDRKGSSTQAIKKFMVTNYNVDPVKIARFIRNYLIGAVADGALVQTKGQGASGRFKLAVVKKKPAKKVPTKKIKLAAPAKAASKAVAPAEKKK